MRALEGGGDKEGKENGVFLVCGSCSTGRPSDQVEKAFDSAGRASEPAGRASELARMASEPVGRAPKPAGGPQSQVGGLGGRREKTERKNGVFLVCSGTIGHRPLWEISF